MVSAPAFDTEGRLKRRATWCAGLSENIRRRIAILGHVPPISTLCFVGENREKAEVGG